MAIVLITSALVFYSLGVWAEHLQKILKPWHVGAFVLGLICDASGTYFMSRIAAGDPTTVQTPLMSIMAVTGAIALILMALHALWAIIVVVRKRDNELRQFHVLSLIVWIIWLIPYFTGAAGAMMQ